MQPSTEDLIKAVAKMLALLPTDAGGTGVIVDQMEEGSDEHYNEILETWDFIEYMTGDNSPSLAFAKTLCALRLYLVAHGGGGRNDRENYAECANMLRNFIIYCMPSELRDATIGAYVHKNLQLCGDGAPEAV